MWTSTSLSGVRSRRSTRPPWRSIRGSNLALVLSEGNERFLRHLGDDHDGQPPLRGHLLLVSPRRAAIPFTVSRVALHRHWTSAALDAREAPRQGPTSIEACSPGTKKVAGVQVRPRYRKRSIGSLRSSQTGPEEIEVLVQGQLPSRRRCLLRQSHPARRSRPSRALGRIRRARHLHTLLTATHDSANVASGRSTTIPTALLVASTPSCRASRVSANSSVAS